MLKQKLNSKLTRLRLHPKKQQMMLSQLVTRQPVMPNLLELTLRRLAKKLQLPQLNEF